MCRFYGIRFCLLSFVFSLIGSASCHIRAFCAIKACHPHLRPSDSLGTKRRRCVRISPLLISYLVDVTRASSYFLSIMSGDNVYEKKEQVLEPTPNGKEAAACLRTAFSAMVAAQLQARDLIGQPRFVDRKSRTANRRATPKKDVSRS